MLLFMNWNCLKLWLWYVYNVLSLNLNILSYHWGRLSLNWYFAQDTGSLSLHPQQRLPLRNPPHTAHVNPTVGFCGVGVVCCWCYSSFRRGACELGEQLCVGQSRGRRYASSTHTLLVPWSISSRKWAWSGHAPVLLRQELQSSSSTSALPPFRGHQRGSPRDVL